MRYSVTLSGLYSEEEISKGGYHSGEMGRSFCHGDMTNEGIEVNSK
jgi:hypothetical protein